MTTDLLTPPNEWFPLTRQLGRVIWAGVTQIATVVGSVAENLFAVARFGFSMRLSWDAFVEQSSFIGVDALGISVIMTLFSGMVIALQVAEELTKQGAGQLVGALVAVTILRELAPIMTGFAVIAMVGSAYSAELATMQTQKQIDALKVLHVDPLRYLVLPRLCAALCMLPLMTILTAMAGIVGGMVVSSIVADLNYNTYLESVWQQVQNIDLIGTEVKAFFFGGIIVMFSTTIGLRAAGGAKEVGNAATAAVVWSFIAMAVADYFISLILFSGNAANV